MTSCARIGLLAVFGACGRLGFDATGGAGTGADGALVDAAPVLGDWNPVSSSPTTANLYAVWGLDPNNIWIAGTGGEVWRFDGTGWVDRKPTGLDAHAVWGASASDVWQSGVDCSVHRWNGAMWTTVTLPSCGGSDINAIAGTAANDLWLAGIAGQIYHYTGTFTLLAQANNMNFSAVFPVGNEAYIAGSTGSMLHWNGSMMLDEHIPTQATLTSVWGASSNDLWTVTSTGAIYHKVNGGIWISVASPTTQALYSVWGTAANDVWAVGAGGVMVHYDGVSWQTVTMRTTMTLRAIRTVPGGGALIVGDGGTVLVSQ